MTIPEQKTQMSFARLLTPKNLGKFSIFHRQLSHGFFAIFIAGFSRNSEI